MFKKILTSFFIFIILGFASGTVKAMGDKDETIIPTKPGNPYYSLFMVLDEFSFIDKYYGMRPLSFSQIKALCHQIEPTQFEDYQTYPVRDYSYKAYWIKAFGEHDGQIMNQKWEKLTDEEKRTLEKRMWEEYQKLMEEKLRESLRECLLYEQNFEGWKKDLSKDPNLIRLLYSKIPSNDQKQMLQDQSFTRWKENHSQTLNGDQEQQIQQLTWAQLIEQIKPVTQRLEALSIVDLQMQQYEQDRQELQRISDEERLKQYQDYLITQYNIQQKAINQYYDTILALSLIKGRDGNSLFPQYYSPYSYYPGYFYQPEPARTHRYDLGREYQRIRFQQQMDDLIEQLRRLRLEQQMRDLMPKLKH